MRHWSCSEAGKVAENDVQFRIDSLRRNVQPVGILVGIVEIDIRRNKIVEHHNGGINGLAGSRHPTLMARHRLRGTDEGTMTKEHFPKRLGFIHVALRGRRGMGVDIVDIVGIHSGIIHSTLHGHTTAILTGREMPPPLLEKP